MWKSLPPLTVEIFTEITASCRVIKALLSLAVPTHVPKTLNTSEN